jgi:hypothetical protein
MERKLGEEQIFSQFNEQPKYAGNILDWELLNSIANLQYVNRKQLINNIETLLNEKEVVTLNDVLTAFPVTKGLAEILGYISLIQTNDKYILNQDKTEYLEFDKKNNKYLKAPQIIFCK